MPGLRRGTALSYLTDAPDGATVRAMKDTSRPEMDRKALTEYRTLIAVTTGKVVSLSEAADDAVRRATALLRGSKVGK